MVILLPLLVAWALNRPTQAQQEYPYFPPTQLSIVAVDDQILEVQWAKHPQLSYLFERSTNATSWPWAPDHSEHTPLGVRVFKLTPLEFYRVILDTNSFTRTNGTAASFSFIAIKRFDGSNQLLTTKSGFVLESFQPWVDQSWIYKVARGPGTTAPINDCEILYRELLDDERTAYVFPVQHGGRTCFFGVFDQLIIQPTELFSDDFLLQNKLVEIKRISGGSYIVVRWLEPKTMDIFQFARQLKESDQISLAEPNAVGCAGGFFPK